MPVAAMVPARTRLKPEQPPTVLVRGNGRKISNLDSTPSLEDGTDFGGAEIGDVLTQEFNLENGTESDITITSLDVVDDEDRFSITIDGGPVPVLLPAGAATRFVVSTTIPTVQFLAGVVMQKAPTHCLTTRSQLSRGESAQLQVEAVDPIVQTPTIHPIIIPPNSIPSLVNHTDFGTAFFGASCFRR